MGQTLSPVFRVQVNSNTLPTWVPPPGSIANISLNTGSSVNPCPAGNCCTITGIGWAADSVSFGTRTGFPPNNVPFGTSMGVTGFGGLQTNGGMIYAAALGAKGSLVCTGGGHGDWHFAHVLRYDLETRLHTCIHTPPMATFRNVQIPATAGLPTYQLYNASGSGSQSAPNPDGEMWTDSTFTTTYESEPGAAHIYGYTVYIPPGVAGTGALGGMITVCRPDLSPIGSGHGKRAHIYDFVTNAWARFSTNYTPPLSGGMTWHTGACYDSLRNCIWAFESTGGLVKLDLATRLFTVILNPGSLSGVGFFGSTIYIPTLDVIAWFLKGSNGSVDIKLVNPANPTAVISPPEAGGPFPPTVANLPPPPAAPANTMGGGDWCPILGPRGCFVCYAGDSTGIATMATPPAGNIYTGTWTWSQVTLGLVAPADQPNFQFVSNQSFHQRFRWADPIKCFLYWASTGAQINAWRLSGT